MKAAAPSSGESRTIRRQTLSGLGWTATSAMFQQVAQFCFTVALARILIPRDFGLIAELTVFTGLALILLDGGFSSSLVQRPEIEERHLSTAFWINVTLGLGIMLLMMGCAPLIARFYDEPRLLPLTLAIAPTFLFGSVSGAQAAVLQREMNFRKIAAIEGAAFLGANVLAITMAVEGLGVWSLVGLTLAAGVLRSTLFWIFSAWRPRRAPDRQSLRELWGFSSRLTGFNIVNYFARTADNLLVGRFIGTTPLAFYNRAYNLMLLPVDVVGTVASRVMFPALSRLQDDREAVKRVYIRALGLIALLTFPTVVGLFVLSEPFILTVYGERWHRVIPLLQILCVASLVQSLNRGTGWIFQSQGRTDWMFRFGIFATATVIGAFLIGLPWGLRGITIAYAIWSVGITVPAFSISGRLVGVSLLDVGKAIVGVGAASFVMGAVVWGLRAEVFDSLSSGRQLAIGIVIGAVVYPLALQAIAPKPYREVKAILREYRQRRAGPQTGSG